jgi:HAD superfamily hydrolase (TIGR01458 family)
LTPSQYRALLVDIDGVLVVSWNALTGATRALLDLRDHGMGVRFLTNTTSRTRHGITSGLRDAGFDVEPDEVITAVGATADYLARHHPNARCYLLNSGDIAADLPDVDLVEERTEAEDVDVVVIGGAGVEFSYAALNHAVGCVLGGAALLAMHRNVVWRTASGLQLDTGAYVIGLERATGVEAVVMGKPAPAMFDAALASLGVAARDAAMVGDDIDSDVRGAQALGITGVQVRTGKFRNAQLDKGVPPDVVLDAFADVPSWLSS